MNGMAEVVYGYLLTDEEIEQINLDGDAEDAIDAIDAWCETLGLDPFYGGDDRWESLPAVVGIAAGFSVYDLGAHELLDSDIQIPPEDQSKLQEHSARFRRDPKRFLVTNYG